MDKIKPIGQESASSYLECTLLPAILEIIEGSGVSCSTALAVPQMLEKRIKSSIAKSNEQHPFIASSCWKRKRK